MPAPWRLEPIYFRLRTGLALSRSSSLVVGCAAALLVGATGVLLFFRLFAAGLRRLEWITNERHIRPNISALRYIGGDDARELLARLADQTRSDFSIGDTTRNTIQTGIAIPARSESELIVMLESSRTMLQAMERLVELGSKRALPPLYRLIDRVDLDDLSYASALRALVRIVKAFPTEGLERLQLEEELKRLHTSAMPYGKRLSAYNGLLDLGISGVVAPKKGLFRYVLSNHRMLAVVVGSFALLLLFMFLLRF